MNRTYKALLKRLHERYPDKHICIILENNYFVYASGLDKYKAAWIVYVEDVGNETLKTLSDAKKYVDNLCKKEG